MMAEENLIYEEETGRLFRIRELATNTPSGKLNCIWLGNEQKVVTHVIWKLKTGLYPPKGMEVDHIDGDATNNSWENLRLATHTQNMHNSIRDTRILNRDEGMAIGVQKRGTKYLVQISGFYVGSFETVVEANIAAEQHRKDIRGEFAEVRRQL